MADEPGLLEHPVPPAVHRVGGAGLLRVGPVDAPVRRALLGVEDVIVWLGPALDELQWLAEVGPECHDDPPAKGDDPLLLAFAEDGELAPLGIEVPNSDASELATSDAAVEQDEQRKAIT